MGEINQFIGKIRLEHVTNLASFHVLEVHPDLRCNTFTESQVRGGNLGLIESYSSVTNRSQRTSKAYSLSPGSWTGVANFLSWFRAEAGLWW